MLHNILLGDSNGSLLTFHQGLLLQAGYRVAVAQDMREAETQLRLAPFSLVIAELALPEEASADALNLIRRVATLRPGTPILVLTSNTSPALHREARSMGVWDISVKPTPWAELLSLTKNILDANYPESLGCQGRSRAATTAGE